MGTEAKIFFLMPTTTPAYLPWAPVGNGALHLSARVFTPHRREWRQFLKEELAGFPWLIFLLAFQKDDRGKKEKNPLSWQATDSGNGTFAEWVVLVNNSFRQASTCLTGSGVQFLSFQSWQSGRGKEGRLHKITNDYDTKEGKVRTKKGSAVVVPKKRRPDGGTGVRSGLGRTALASIGQHRRSGLWGGGNSMSTGMKVGEHRIHFRSVHHGPVNATRPWGYNGDRTCFRGIYIQRKTDIKQAMACVVNTVEGECHAQSRWQGQASGSVQLKHGEI